MEADDELIYTTIMFPSGIQWKYITINFDEFPSGIQWKYITINFNNMELNVQI